ncbi:MAG: hypothetical protein NZM43_13355, partial [Saprospiraceae bacterium]|nr:hypothetical protein [Saprospiraceae bacterium]MDW8485302.1 hypothetical protein [Saprospiraceae bacterium]
DARRWYFEIGFWDGLSPKDGGGLFCYLLCKWISYCFLHGVVESVNGKRPPGVDLDACLLNFVSLRTLESLGNFSLGN